MLLGCFKKSVEVKPEQQRSVWKMQLLMIWHIHYTLIETGVVWCCCEAIYSDVLDHKSWKNLITSVMTSVK